MTYTIVSMEFDLRKLLEILTSAGNKHNDEYSLAIKMEFIIKKFIRQITALPPQIMAGITDVEEPPYHPSTVPPFEQYIFVISGQIYRINIRYSDYSLDQDEYKFIKDKIEISGKDPAIVEGLYNHLIRLAIEEFNRQVKKEKHA